MQCTVHYLSIQRLQYILDNNRPPAGFFYCSKKQNSSLKNDLKPSHCETKNSIYKAGRLSQ